MTSRILPGGVTVPRARLDASPVHASLSGTAAAPSWKCKCRNRVWGAYRWLSDRICKVVIMAAAYARETATYRTTFAIVRTHN